jgi:hypothetical protein
MVDEKILDATDMSRVQDMVIQGQMRYKPTQYNVKYIKQMHRVPEGAKEVHDRSLYRIPRDYGYGHAFMSPIVFKHRDPSRMNDNRLTLVEATNHVVGKSLLGQGQEAMTGQEVSAPVRGLMLTGTKHRAPGRFNQKAAYGNGTSEVVQPYPGERKAAMDGALVSILEGPFTDKAGQSPYDGGRNMGQVKSELQELSPSKALRLASEALKRAAVLETKMNSDVINAYGNRGKVPSISPPLIEGVTTVPYVSAPSTSPY